MRLEEALKSNKFKNSQHKATLNVLYTAWCLKSEMSRVLKSFGLTHEQYNVMRILKGKHPEQMCVKDIANRMIEKSSNVPRIIDRLVAKEWVIRSTSEIDKRETVNQLTEEGIRILQESTKALDVQLELMMQLNEDQAAQLNELLEGMRK